VSYVKHCIIKHVLIALSLGVFAKLQKATRTFVMYVWPSIHLHEQLGSLWIDFHEI